MGSYFSAAVAQRGNPSPYDAMIDQLAGQVGIEPALVRAVIAAESAWNPTAVSGTGSSYGLMQLNIAAHGLTADYAFNPATAIGYGAQLLAAQLARLGDLQLALAAYNAGTGRTAADLSARLAGNVNGVGDYVRTVLDYLGYYRGLAALQAAPAPAQDSPDAELGTTGGAGDGMGVLTATGEAEMPAWGLLAALGVGIVALVVLARS